jgi:hypothetical protein
MVYTVWFVVIVVVDDDDDDDDDEDDDDDVVVVHVHYPVTVSNKLLSLLLSSLSLLSL